MLVCALVVLAAVLSVLAPEAEAQCAMCKTAVRASGEVAARTMKSAMLVLLIPSVTIFCSIFVIILRYKKRDEADAVSEGRDG